MLTIAHRGFSARAPENTLAAFRLALDHHVDAIELDVHLSADSQVIVIHDATLDRTTRTPGIVAAMPASQIQRANAAAFFPSHTPHETVPTLRQALQLIPPSVRVLIEIKAPAATLPTLQLLQELGRTRQAVIISFAPEALALVHATRPDIQTALLLSSNIIENNPIENARQMLARARALGTSILDLQHTIATPDTVREIHSLGGSAWVWTVNTPQSIHAMLHANVDAITTDHPDQLRQILHANS